MVVISNQSSVNIDLGTTTNLNSSYTVTNGINNETSLTNSDGVEVDGVSTTYTVTDGDGMEVTSFTSSVDATTGSDINFVGTELAAAVNSNTETPIDFTATWDLATKTLVFTGATPGQAGPWTVTVNNNGQVTNAGDIAVASSASTDVIVNEVSTLRSTGPIAVDRIAIKL